MSGDRLILIAECHDDNILCNRLPPKRDIDFTIELVPRAALV